MKRFKFIKRLFCIFAVVIVAFLGAIITTEPVIARPGGGHGYHGGGGGHSSGHSHSGSHSSSHHSYSGGGSSYSSSDDMSFEDLICMFILFVIGSIVYGIYSLGERIFGGSRKKVNVISNPSKKVLQSIQSKTDKAIKRFQQKDPNFSLPVFLDFATVLYTKFYSYSGTKDIKTLSPFFTSLKTKQDRTYHEIVIGNLSVFSINVEKERIVLTIDSNLTSVNKNNKASLRLEMQERWDFTRKKGSLSPEPQGFGVLRCPNCGGSADFTEAGVCPHCGSTITFDFGQWYVANRVVTRQEQTYTDDMLSYAEEYGTDSPTIFSSDLSLMSKEFASNNPNLQSYSNFAEQIVKPCFLDIYKFWNDNEWDKARFLVSERQWQVMNFYIEDYKKLGYFNRVTSPKISKMQVVKYTVDKNYESITVRIFASCCDFVEDSHGKCLAGNKRVPRSFSEYWTFVSRKGVNRKKHDSHVCPSCGAPADKIGQGGICGYCGSKITDGNFSWILFNITQDEEYKG